MITDYWTDVDMVILRIYVLSTINLLHQKFLRLEPSYFYTT